MRMRGLGLALGLLIAATSAPAFAEGGQKILRFGPAYVSPTGDFSKTQRDEPPLLGVGVFGADSAVGAFVGFEFLLTDLVGLDATAMYSNHAFTDSYTETVDGEVVYENYSSGDASMTSLLLSANFHFLRSPSLDLYAGPTVGYEMYGDVYDRAMKSDFSYGAVAGIDVPFGASKWMFSSTVRYIKTQAQTEATDPGSLLDIPMDPWIVHAGVGFKF